MRSERTKNQFRIYRFRIKMRMIAIYVYTCAEVSVRRKKFFSFYKKVLFTTNIPTHQQENRFGIKMRSVAIYVYIRVGFFRRRKNFFYLLKSIKKVRLPSQANAPAKINNINILNTHGIVLCCSPQRIQVFS